MRVTKKCQKCQWTGYDNGREIVCQPPAIAGLTAETVKIMFDKNQCPKCCGGLAPEKGGESRV